MTPRSLLEDLRALQRRAVADRADATVAADREREDLADIQDLIAWCRQRHMPADQVGIVAALIDPTVALCAAVDEWKTAVAGRASAAATAVEMAEQHVNWQRQGAASPFYQQQTSQPTGNPMPTSPTTTPTPAGTGLPSSYDPTQGVTMPNGSTRCPACGYSDAMGNPIGTPGKSHCYYTSCGRCGRVQGPTSMWTSMCPYCRGGNDMLYDVPAGTPDGAPDPTLCSATALSTPHPFVPGSHTTSRTGYFYQWNECGQPADADVHIPDPAPAPDGVSAPPEVRPLTADERAERDRRNLLLLFEQAARAEIDRRAEQADTASPHDVHIPDPAPAPAARTPASVAKALLAMRDRIPTGPGHGVTTEAAEQLLDGLTVKQLRDVADTIGYPAGHLRTKDTLVKYIVQNSVGLRLRSYAIHPRWNRPAADQPAEKPLADRIRDTCSTLATPGAWVGLADLRAALPDVPRDQLDAALSQLSRTPGVSVIPLANRKALTDRDRDAAWFDGVEACDAIQFRTTP